MVEIIDDSDDVDLQAAVDEMLNVTDAVIPKRTLEIIRELQSDGKEEFSIDIIKDYDPDIREKVSPESQKAFDYAIKETSFG